MRIVDLSDNLDDTIEMLRTAAINRVGYTTSCFDLTADEFATHVGKLLELARLTSTLAEIAVETFAEHEE